MKKTNKFVLQKILGVSVISLALLNAKICTSDDLKYGFS